MHHVLSDSRNFLWFATDHGVCRYDGYKFETFNLPDNSILGLFEDFKKRIWAITFSGRLFYYEHGKWVTYKFNDLVIENIASVAICQIFVDTAENLYVTTTNPNNFMIDREGTVSQITKDTRNFYYEISEISDGVFNSYVRGFTFLYKGAGSFPADAVSEILIKTKSWQTKINFRFISMGRKSRVRKFSNGDLVFFIESVLFRVSPDGSYITKDMGGVILDVQMVTDNHIFVATIQDGVHILNEEYEIVDNLFPGYSVTSIEKDYEGGLWISTTQGGVYYLSSLEIKHLSQDQKILDQNFLCLDVIKDKGIWAGGDSRDVLYIEPLRKIINHSLTAVSINGIHANIFPDTVVLHVGFQYSDGLRIKSKKNHGKTILSFQAIGDIAYSNGNYWSGSPLGIVKPDFKQEHLQVQNKSPLRVASLFLDKNGSLVVGNQFGLWRFISDSFQLYDASRDILRSRITAINEYKGNLCLGTRGKGFLFLVSDSLYSISEAEGLASNNIRKIFIDEDVVWLATNKGLSRVEIQSLIPLHYTIRNISVQDGLSSNEVNDIRRLGDDLVVASKSGITFFQKDLFSGKKKSLLSLYVTGVKINGADTTLSSHYDLDYTQSSLVFSFTALSYRESSNLEYRYRFSGSNNDWINTTGREIQFNPIPYGSYTLQVQARRYGEPWPDDPGISISINRKPPFWKLTWFWVASFILVALLMFLLFARRTRKIRQREEERTMLNKRVAEMEMKALRAQMNPHFIFNVLNSIQYFITHNDSDKAHYYMSKFAKLVRLTLDNSRSTFISLADELSLLRLYIELEKVRFEDRFEYAITIEEGLAVVAIQIPNMLLQPYVENSIKHGFRNRNTKYFLAINISKENGNIVCTIQDNGIGREEAGKVSGPEKEGHTSRGTAIINEKIEALKFYYHYDLSSSTEDVLDDEGNVIGTKVTLVFPEKSDTR